MTHRRIQASAPIRVCDNGGWTDTWFAGHGKVFNIGVGPRVEVELEVLSEHASSPRVLIHASSEPHPYEMSFREGNWGSHPLLEAALLALRPPSGMSLRVTTDSAVPPGASTGTSAAVSVALLSALSHLRGDRLDPRRLAAIAHSLETEILGQQSGVQDQICAALGGIHYIEISPYPEATATRLHVSENFASELGRRLLLVYLGSSHQSSQVHEQVIDDLKDLGPDCRELIDLRRAAEKARDAVLSEDLASLGLALTENTDAQARLYPDLLSREAREIMKMAQGHGALGVKLNGAGGSGGSLTLLCDLASKRTLLRDILALNPKYRHVPVVLSPRGVSVEKAS